MLMPELFSTGTVSYFRWSPVISYTLLLWAGNLVTGNKHVSCPPAKHNQKGRHTLALIIIGIIPTTSSAVTVNCYDYIVVVVVVVVVEVILRNAMNNSWCCCCVSPQSVSYIFVVPETCEKCEKFSQPPSSITPELMKVTGTWLC